MYPFISLSLCIRQYPGRTILTILDDSDNWLGVMNTWAPVFASILDSSINEEPYHVRLLWIAMLALKDADHVVRSDSYKLHKKANLPEMEVIDGLRVLESPDLRRIGPQEYEGRRIEKVEEGWKVLNGQKYENMMRKVKVRAYKRQKAAEYYAAKGGTLAERLAGEGVVPISVRTGEEKLVDEAIERGRHEHD